MSLLNAITIGLLLLALQLLFATTSSITCADVPPSTQSTGSTCKDAYTDKIQDHMKDLEPTARNGVKNFRTYLGNILLNTVWYTFWNDQKTAWDTQNVNEVDISYCDAIIPIKDDLPSCLCQLHAVCDSLCDEYIGNIFEEHNDAYAFILDNEIPYDQGVTHEDCRNVMQIITPIYQNLCGDTPIYKLIQQCANITSPITTNVTPSLSPTTSPIITTTTSPTTLSPIYSTQAQTSNSTATPTITQSEPPSASLTTKPSNTNVTETDLLTTTVPPDDYDTYNYDDFDTSTTTEDTLDDIELTAASHPFANLLLVSLIILGFCVFVAWYAKKNQISSDGSQRRENGNGYLWGLNQSASASPTQARMLSDDGDTHNSHSGKFGQYKHKKLSQFDETDSLEQAMNIQMSPHNNDLLAITPDHVGRLQTRVPNAMAPGIPHKHSRKPASRKKGKSKPQRPSKRKGGGSKFQRLQDVEEVMESGSESESSSGVDMMSAEMRDKFDAAHTWSKRVADTFGDISESVKETAQAVKTKLIKREQPVVVPMQLHNHGKNGGSGHGPEKKYPFTMVEDNETTDGFEYGDEAEMEPEAEASSSSTQENEYREDSETEVRVNVHGRKIKQPMKLPTFDDVDGALAQSHGEDLKAKASGKKARKHKKKHRKKKRKKERKSKEKEVEEVEVGSGNKVEVERESHDINVLVNNEENMGFGSDELNEDNVDIELSKEEVTMTMNDLQMELLKHNQTVGDRDKDGNEDVAALSFMDNIGGNEDNVAMAEHEENMKDLVALSNGNVVVGNGTA